MDWLPLAFFQRDCLKVAPDLVGKVLVFKEKTGTHCLRITETEAYRGEDDTACHAHKGRTKRTEVMYGAAGTLYVYLCYGRHWLLNIVTGRPGEPQAVLVRACDAAPGPGRLTHALGITGELNGKTVGQESGLFVADDGVGCRVIPDTRVGIGYASAEDQARLWRFKADTQEAKNNE